MRFINKYAVRDSEEPIAEAETDDFTPSSEEEGKSTAFYVFCLACSTP